MEVVASARVMRWNVSADLDIVRNTMKCAFAVAANRGRYPQIGQVMAM